MDLFGKNFRIGKRRVPIKNKVNESDQIDAKTLSKFNGIINSKNYSGFVSALGSAATDPKIQLLLKNGLNDGNLRDDNIKFNLKYIPCYKLRPTQNEIDLDKSLSFQLKTLTTQITQIEGGNVTIVGPIVTLNSKFIIDGHHRWSQVYCMNPKAKIASLNLERADLSWIDGLKAVQLSIASSLGTLPSQDVSGQNLFSVDNKKLVSYVMSKITDNVAMAIALNENVQVKIGRDITPSTSIYEMKRAVAEYIWENVKVFKKLAAPPAGAAPRGIMPQTDSTDFQNTLRAGIINISHPIVSTEITENWMRKLLSFGDI